MSDEELLLTSQQHCRQAEEALRRTLASAGYAQHQEGLKTKLRKYLRDTVFRKVKFARQEVLQEDGNVYNHVKGHLGFDINTQSTTGMSRQAKNAAKKRYDEQYKHLWNAWIRAECKKNIANKRNATTQRIHRTIVQGKVGKLSMGEKRIHLILTMSLLAFFPNVPISHQGRHGRKPHQCGRLGSENPSDLPRKEEKPGGVCLVL